MAEGNNVVAEAPPGSIRDLMSDVLSEIQNIAQCQCFQIILGIGSWCLSSDLFAKILSESTFDYGQYQICVPAQGFGPEAKMLLCSLLFLTSCI